MSNAPTPLSDTVSVSGQPIIFFDGVCAMCNTFVEVVVRADRRGIFRFAPLQGETARQLLPLAGTSGIIRFPTSQAAPL